MQCMQPGCWARVARCVATQVKRKTAKKLFESYTQQRLKIENYPCAFLAEANLGNAVDRLPVSTTVKKLEWNSAFLVSSAFWVSSLAALGQRLVVLARQRPAVWGAVKASQIAFTSLYGPKVLGLGGAGIFPLKKKKAHRSKNPAPPNAPETGGGGAGARQNTENRPSGSQPVAREITWGRLVSVGVLFLMGSSSSCSRERFSNHWPLIALYTIAHIHTPMVVSAMQDDSQLVGSS